MTRVVVEVVAVFNALNQLPFAALWPTLFIWDSGLDAKYFPYIRVGHDYKSMSYV